MWEERAPQERVLLIVLAIFSLVVVFYLLVYQPLQHRQTAALERYHKEISDYQWLRSKTREIIKLKSQARGVAVMVRGSAQVRSAIENSLGRYNLNAKIELKDEEEGNQLVEINFDNQNGSTVMQWLAANMQSGYLLRTLDLNSKSDGTVSATVYFEL